MSIFAPLHIISGYSLLKSGLTMDKILSSIKENDFYGAGLSDDECMFGVPSFIQTMESINKPFIIGTNEIIENNNLTLFAINEIGYRNLIKLNSIRQIEGEISIESLSNNSDGILCVIESKYGDFFDRFNQLTNIDTTFTKYLLKISSIFKCGFYLGIEITSKEDIVYANKVRKFANAYTYNCVAFPRIKYAKKDDAIVLKIVEAISNQTTLEEKSATGQEYFMSEVDYQKIYTKNEIENTINIINKANFLFHQKRGEIIHFPKEKSLDELCFIKLKEKQLDKDRKHIDRLNYELNIINKMGYSDYFLLVQDYVNWCKSNDILVGPGRGSAAGSLVSYLLNITEVDPLQYNLQFERFLNEHRKTMPDIDVDFMDIKRDNVIQYMRETYGKNKVANIITFQTMLAKQSLRDIGKVFNYQERHISALCKQLKEKDYDLRTSYKRLPEFRKLVDSDPFFLEIVTLASKIEGLPRQTGVHPAGIVLNEKSIDESLPVIIDANDNYLTQYEAPYLEEQGFLKMDFLGLRNLTIIYNCVDLINKNHKDAKLDKFNLPYDEKEVYELICEMQTMGLFQIEGAGMKKAIKILKPNCFEEVAILLAIYRPGPLDSIKTYALRKQGKERFRYVSNDLESVLSSTYGIIVFQEQINDIARIMAGFSMAEADLFRRAVSKKDKDKLESGRESFIKGAIANGYSEKTATDTFNHIMRFAEYGFNKSHSIVYAITSLRMAWLKLHYPLEFYACTLENHASGDETTLNDYISEMKKRGFKILSPSINYSTNEFETCEKGLRYPLNKIKNIGEQITKAIIEERNKGLFKDFFDFVIRMWPKGINEKILINLINSGALDELYPSRASMIASISNALTASEICYNENKELNINIYQTLEKAMFDKQDDPIENLEKEYDALGIMLSNNPLYYKKDLLNKNNVESIIETKEEYESDSQINGYIPATYTIAGIIKSIKVINTKKGEKMAYVRIFDETSDLEVTIFPRTYQIAENLIKKNNIVVIKGKYDTRNDELSLLVDDIKLLEE